MFKSTVQKVIHRIREIGSPLPRKTPGSLKKLSERAQRHLERIIRSSPFASYDSVRFELQQAEITISRQTVINYLWEMGFKSYFAAHKPSLTEANKKRRLRWALNHANWTQEQWESVVWSDESRFTVEGYDGGARVIRKVGERYEARHVKPTTKWGHGKCYDMELFLGRRFWAFGDR
ncbi:hypothetical protein RMATCC62417_00463 [Rhizopus microsporus]|nr:hypothetical protein RMATCC62417_00463 [Rhizopus microsporus]